MTRLLKIVLPTSVLVAALVWSFPQQANAGHGYRSYSTFTAAGSGTYVARYSPYLNARRYYGPPVYYAVPRRYV